MTSLRTKARRIVIALAVAQIALVAIYFPYSVDPPHIPPRITAENTAAYKSFWEGERSPVDTNHIYYQRVSKFVREYGLSDSKVLEVGAGMGKLQDIVENYTGLDISESSAKHFHKPFVHASATSMPFADNSFDVLWTINVIEHVPNPEHALIEMRRVLRSGGYLYLSPAWQCRSWAARGYQVRPWGDFGVGGKAVKASIPLRDSIAYRALYTIPIRLLRSPVAMFGPTNFRYNTIAPNYRIGEKLWLVDSDAVNSMDAFEAIIWFTSRGDTCLNYQDYWDQLTVRNGPLIFRINKGQK